jgi:hypothetical protein
MLQSRAQALAGRFLEVAQNSVDAAHVDSRVPLGDTLGALPAPLVFDEPSALLFREILQLDLLGNRHAKTVAWRRRSNIVRLGR